MSDEPELIVDIKGGIALVTLNRPHAFNALTLDMVRAVAAHLHSWATDPDIRAVVVQGAGEKAFCAGGDIRKLYEARALGPVPTDFFYEEYVMNSRIHHFPKPYISLLDGITMGGGVGISAHGRYRVATERTLWAMPETAIGLFPDVGGSYLLPRLAGKLGLYLGLTGTRLRAAEVMACGLATHFVPHERLDALVAALISGEDVEAVLNRFRADAGVSALADLSVGIDRLFSAPTLERLLADLAAEGGALAQTTLITLRKMSPTSLKLTLAAYQRGMVLSFDEVMQMEFRVVSRLMQGDDFFEGVRAALIDRDQAPKWQPWPCDAVIDAYFAPLDRDLPL